MVTHKFNDFIKVKYTDVKGILDSKNIQIVGNQASSPDALISILNGAVVKPNVIFFAQHNYING